jgi:hypothetical protein
MVCPDALPIVLHQDTMRPAAADLDPSITLERGEDAGSFWAGGEAGGEKVLGVIIATSTCASA